MSVMIGDNVQKEGDRGSCRNHRNITSHSEWPRALKKEQHIRNKLYYLNHAQVHKKYWWWTVVTEKKNTTLSWALLRGSIEIQLSILCWSSCHSQLKVNKKEQWSLLYLSNFESTKCTAIYASRQDAQVWLTVQGFITSTKLDGNNISTGGIFFTLHCLVLFVRIVGSQNMYIWRHSRSDWTGFWAPWSSCRCYCSLQESWTRIPTQIFQWFYDN